MELRTLLPFALATVCALAGCSGEISGPGDAAEHDADDGGIQDGDGIGPGDDGGPTGDDGGPLGDDGGPSTGIIPPERRIEWSGQVGIPGGIPERSSLCATLDAATYGDGATDATSAIQVALDNPTTRWCSCRPGPIG